MADATSPPLDPVSRAWALGTAAIALLTLLIELPPGLAGGFGLAALAVAALSWRNPLPGWLRLLLTLAMVAAVFAAMGTRFGRDTGCALLAAMLAIKPSETHGLRDARSLVGFALFAPFAAFLLDQGPLAMLLGLASALGALLTLQRLADLEAGIAPLMLRGRLGTTTRLVALGVPLALVAFWLFPRLGSPLWGVPERAVASTGLSDSMSPGGWLDLMADDAPALRAEFAGAMPDARQLYWRGPVLPDFDGTTWTRSPWAEGLPVPQVRSGDVAWDYEIEMEPTDQRYLVALDLPTTAPDGARLRSDYGLQSGRSLSATTRWRLRSAPPLQFEDTLNPVLRQQALALPSDRNPRTLALARQWRDDAGDDDGAIVDRALAWISQEFAYTLDTPLPGRHGTDEFLFDQKQGYCEHFSSAFAVLMRGAGIPARVVTGYAGGYRNPFGGYWIVRRMDAHAWVEVWLPQRGWVRVDPTAAVAPERIYDTVEQRVGTTGGADTLGMLRMGGIGDLGDWLRRSWNTVVVGFDAGRQQAMLRPMGIDRLTPTQLLAIFAGLAGASLLGMVWLLARGERERDPLLRAWHLLCARYARIGLGRAPHEPALAWAQRVGRLAPDTADTLIPLSRRFAAARYAGAVGGMDQLVRDLRRHRPRPYRRST